MSQKIKSEPEEPSYPKLRVHTILGTKGGVGKSTAAVHLLDWFNARNLPVTSFDLDDENATLHRFVPSSQCLNTRDREQADMLVVKAEELAMGKDHAAIVIDLRAGSGDDMLAWFAEVPFDYLAENGIEFVGWACVTSDPDSQQTVSKWLEKIGSKLASCVFVKNLKDGDFQYNIPDCAPKLTATVIIEQIDSRVMSRINEQALPLGDILKLPKGMKGLTDTMMYTRLIRYRDSIFKQLDAIKDILVAKS